MDLSEVDVVFCEDIESFDTFIALKEKEGVGRKDGAFKIKFDSNTFKKNISLLNIVSQIDTVQCQTLLKSGAENIYQYKRAAASEEANSEFLREASKISSYSHKSCCSLVLEKDGHEALLQHFFSEVLQPVEQSTSDVDKTINDLLKEGKKLNKTYVSNDVHQLIGCVNRKEEVHDLCNCFECVEERNEFEIETSSNILYACGIAAQDDAEPVFVTNNFSLSRIKNVLMLLDNKYPGLSSPYYYLGRVHSFFPLHIEDASLWSINVLHFGQPKIWLVIPPEAIVLLMYHLSKSRLSMGNTSCWNFLGHKNALPSPVWLEERSIPFKMIVQEAGEAVVLYPDAAHMGWNTGWNMAEAINFGTVSWIEHGIQSLRCQCLSQQIHLDLRKIVAAFKPHLLSPWLKGQYVVNSKERAMIDVLSNAVQERLKKTTNGENLDTIRFLDCPLQTCSKKYPFHAKKRLENHVQREHKPLLEKLDLLEKINEQHKKLKLK